MPLLRVHVNLYLNYSLASNMKPIQVNFKRSMIASALFTLMSVGALFIVILLTMSLQLKLLLSFMIVFSAIHAVSKHGLLLLPWSCVKLSINTKNQLQFTRKDGKQLEVLVQANSVVTPYLIILNSQIKEASFLQRLFVQHLIIFPDAVDAENYRQLRVWLRWGCYA